MSCARRFRHSYPPVAVASKVVLAGALLMARVEEEARDLCAEFVRDAKSQYRLTWPEIGAAFGITMQSAQWRFGRPPRKTASRMRRGALESRGLLADG